MKSKLIASSLVVFLLSGLACSGTPAESDGDGDAADFGAGGGWAAAGGQASSGGTGQAGVGGGALGVGGTPSGTGGMTAGVGGATNSGSGGSSSDGCTGISDIFSESEFNALFPSRNSAYTYQGMVDAATGAGDLIGFPQFAAEGSCDTRKRELAAFLANVARETGQLVYIEQIDKSFQYCDANQSYGCPAGSGQYYGRGPIQLSWNYNYRAASFALFGDDRLLENPGLVAEDPAVAWATGFWFWMIGGAGGDGSYSPHSVMVAEQGFGATIDIINGYEECDGGTAAYATESVSQRVCYYEKYTSAFGVTVGPGNLDCGTMTDDSHCGGI